MLTTVKSTVLTPSRSLVPALVSPLLIPSLMTLPAKVIYFPLSTGTAMDFYRGLAAGLVEEPKFRKVDLFHQIQHAIQVFFQERKITPVFILDEMQMAKDLFFCYLSILFNFGMD